MSEKSKSKKNGSRTDLPDTKTNSDTKNKTANLQNSKKNIDNI